MTYQEKVQALLKANKDQYKTFDERARNARLICGVGEVELEFIADALNVSFK